MTDSCQSQSAGFGQSELTDFTESNSAQIDFLALDYETVHSEDFNHVWYFELILEHTLFSINMLLLAMICTFLCEFVVFRMTWKV